MPPSPPSQPRDHPPQRPALHERSESQANRRPPPSLRVVGQPDASIYDTSPFPTKPSQVLRPSRKERGRGQLSDPSTQGSPQNAGNSWGASSLFFAGRSQFGGLREHPPGQDTQRSSADVSFYSTSTDESVSRDDPGIRTSTSFLTEIDQEHGEEEPESQAGKGRVSADSILQLPSVPPRADGHTLPPTLTPEGNLDRQPANKDSDGSLNSTNSTGTVIVKKTRDGRKRASYSTFPFIRPSSSKSNVTVTTPPRTARKLSEETIGPQPLALASSPPSTSRRPSTDRQSLSGSNASDTPHAHRESVEYQYPIVRSQQVSASWAESSSASQAASQTTARGSGRWNPHLSTVQSEGTGSYSGERSSQGTELISPSHSSDSSSNMLSDPRLSTDYPPVPRRSLYHDLDLQASHGYATMPGPSNSTFPVPGAVRPRDVSGSTIRSVNERDEVAYPPAGRARDASGTTVRLVSEQEEMTAGSTLSEAKPTGTLRAVPRENSRNPVFRPTSRASFFRDSIPTWAKSVANLYKYVVMD